MSNTYKEFKNPSVEHLKRDLLAVAYEIAFVSSILWVSLFFCTIIFGPIIIFVIRGLYVYDLVRWILAIIGCAFFVGVNLLLTYVGVRNQKRLAFYPYLITNGFEILISYLIVVILIISAIFYESEVIDQLFQASDYDEDEKIGFLLIASILGPITIARTIIYCKVYQAFQSIQYMPIRNFKKPTRDAAVEAKLLMSEIKPLDPIKIMDEKPIKTNKYEMYENEIQEIVHDLNERIHYLANKEYLHSPILKANTGCEDP